MTVSEFKVKLPENLVLDFSSDPLAPFDKLLRKANDSTWPLYPELSRCLASLPAEDIEAAYADNTFAFLYGKNEASRASGSSNIFWSKRRRAGASMSWRPRRRRQRHHCPIRRIACATHKWMARAWFDWLISNTTMRHWRRTDSASPSVPRPRARIRPTGFSDRFTIRASPITSASALTRFFGVRPIRSRRRCTR